jgi:cytoskeletal protein CcmA (bactofilin family)
MAKQSNFKIAVNELMNGVLGSEQGEDQMDEATDNSTWEALRKISSEERQGFQDVLTRKPPGNSVIAEDLIVEGSIFGESTIQINGKVKGNVSITGDIISKGTIEGDAKGNNVILNKSNIKGNVNANLHLSVDSDSVIIGNIAAASIEVDGKVKGDIHAEDVVELKKSAVVFGNVAAKTVSMEAGASLKGQINVLSQPISEKDLKFESSFTSPSQTPTSGSEE